MAKFEDGLDIASVSGYTEGRGRRHWCLPAGFSDLVLAASSLKVWALAAAAERDVNLEGLSIDCARSNSTMAVNQSSKFSQDSRATFSAPRQGARYLEAARGLPLFLSRLELIGLDPCCTVSMQLGLQ